MGLGIRWCMFLTLRLEINCVVSRDVRSVNLELPEGNIEDERRGRQGKTEREGGDEGV